MIESSIAERRVDAARDISNARHAINLALSEDGTLKKLDPRFVIGILRTANNSLQSAIDRLTLKEDEP